MEWMTMRRSSSSSGLESYEQEQRMMQKEETFPRLWFAGENWICCYWLWGKEHRQRNIAKLSCEHRQHTNETKKKNYKKCQSSRKKLKLKSKNCKTQIENWCLVESMHFFLCVFSVFWLPKHSAFCCFGLFLFQLAMPRQHSIKIQFAIEFVFTRYPSISLLSPPSPSCWLSLSFWQHCNLVNIARIANNIIHIPNNQFTMHAWVQRVCYDSANQVIY